MKNISNNTIVSVGMYKGSKTKPLEANKKGLFPLYLTVVSGLFPEGRNVLDGSIAEGLEIEAGNSYMLVINETETNEYGRQFQFTNMGKVSLMEFALASKKLEKPQIFSLETAEEKANRVAANVEAKIAAEMAEK